MLYTSVWSHIHTQVKLSYMQVIEEVATAFKEFSLIFICFFKLLEILVSQESSYFSYNPHQI